MQTVLWVLAGSTLYVPSGADPGNDFEGFRPVFYPQGAHQMLAAFTNPQWAEPISSLAPWMVTTTGEDLITRMPPENGLVINPGAPNGFDVAPEGVEAFRRELSG